jgi:nicotinamide-nucleotide amidase
MNPDLTSRLARPLRVVAIGDELMRGDHPDTNSPWLAERLAKLSQVPDSIEQLPDRDGAAEAAVRRWVKEGGTLFLGGGLGPTEDDATREEIAAGLDVDLELNDEAAQMIRDLEIRRSHTFTSYTHRQAQMPGGCSPLFNPRGTAPAIFCEREKGFLLVLPGVPSEYKAIAESILPLPEDAVRAQEWRLAGLGEDKLATLLEDLPDLEQLGFYPNREGIRVRVPAENFDHDELARRLAKYLVSRHGETLEEVVVKLLQVRGETLSVAESCTGGLLGARITRVSGASKVFEGGVQSYSNEAKENLLDVSTSILIDHGAVSEACARAMAEGARDKLGTDWALSITGIAGPVGGTDEKPVGTMHFALAGPDETKSTLRRAPWDREGNRRYAVQEALTLLWMQISR